NGAPGVRSRVVCELCTWRGPAAYHVDFTIEQHTRHIALAPRHRGAVGIAVRHRVVDINLSVACADGVVTADRVHQAIERCRCHAGARRGQHHTLTPGIGRGVVNLHVVEWPG